MTTSLSEQVCYTLINTPESDQLSDMQIKESLEKGDLKTKIDTLKKLIYMALNGEKVSNSVLMYVIRFCLPSQDHLMKKLLLIFWEVVPKTSPDGKLLHEMILVCDAYRKDLQHPNEFVRGSTLRFLCKLKEPELIEPLMPAIRTCLEHRHNYVRRNAVLAIYTIYKNFSFLIPDAPELVYNFLEVEQDASCKRNAFIMLIHVDQQRALDYLSGCIDQVTSFGDILQLIIVELIYKVCHANPIERGRFIRCVFNLLQSTSAAVRYEAAGTLVTLSTAPTAVKAAASCYIDLIVKESDNNVKLIVLDRLVQLRNNSSNEKVLQELVIDILRVLSSPDLEVRRKTLQLALDLVSSRNVEEMVMFLRKEISKTTNASEQDDTAKYRQLLVRTLHSMTIKFPEVAQSVMPLLMEFLSDKNDLAAGDVLVFVREAIQRLPDLRPIILQQLMEIFPQIRHLKTFRAALWILGEYCSTIEDLQRAMTLIRQTLGDLPIVEDELRLATNDDKEKTSSPADNDYELKAPVKRLVTADGTYATQSALTITQNGIPASGRAATSDSTSISNDANKPPLRKLLLDGEFFIGASLATVLCKLVTRYHQQNSNDKDRKCAQFSAEAMYILACIVHFGKTSLPKTNITEDDLDRIGCCLRYLSENFPLGVEIFTKKCRQSLIDMLEAKRLYDQDEMSKHDKARKSGVQTDDPIPFSQLRTVLDSALGGAGAENLFDLSLSQALGVGRDKNKKFDLSSSKLGKVVQLSGFSDPVYAECYVNVNQYDVVLDVLIVNQTSDTLENLCIELATLGDLKLVDKPAPLTIAPNDFANVKASIKVASTENGLIFGTIVYDVRGATGDRNCVYLNDIHVDIVDYIIPATCTDTEFRQMWADFEWENKVVVNTPITDLHEYLRHIAKATNLKCLTLDQALAGDCGFLAANFYAHSIFGEDALANMSIEKASGDDPLSPVVGHIRIRAKSQGMALSLGDKVNSAQKVAPKQQEKINDVTAEGLINVD